MEEKEKRVNKDSFVNFVIEPFLKRKLEKIALDREMSTGALIRKILKDWLKDNSQIDTVDDQK